jgi:hypothetical protein
VIAKQDFDQLMNQARVKIMGASDAALKAELFDVLTEFFDVSSCWSEHIPIDGVAYQREYPLPIHEGQIIRFGGCFANSTFPTQAAYEAALALNPAQPGGWYPMGAAMPDIGVMVLSNCSIPNTNQFMRATVIKNVVLPTTRDMVPIAPDWVLPRYHLGILDGLMGKMMNQASKSYSNDALGTYHLKRFQEAISRARVAAIKANTYGAQAWRFPQSFSTRTQHGLWGAGTSTRF